MSKLAGRKNSPMANPHAVLSLLDAPDCCDTGLYVIWNRFRQLRRFLAYRPDEIQRVYRLIRLGCCWSTWSWSDSLDYLFSFSVRFCLGLSGGGLAASWVASSLGCFPVLIRIFKSAIFSAWRGRAADILTSRKGFRGGPFLDYDGTRQLLFSSHLRERDKMLLRSILSGGGGLGTDSYLAKPRRKKSLAVFVGVFDGEGHLFWDCPFPPLCAYS